jgi:NAD(P)H-dependent FMN reductase
MIDIAIIIGSTRPNRVGEAVGKWVYEQACTRTDANFEIVDLATYALPLLDERMPAMFRQYEHAHTQAWSRTIARFDGFVFVTPEYNHGPSAALKNAIDYLYGEWANKAAGFVGYGASLGMRAVEQLRLILAAVEVATVTAQVGLSMITDFEQFSIFKPGAHHEPYVQKLLAQVVAWSGALKRLRA